MRLPRSRTTQLHHQHLLRDRDFLRSRLDRKTPRRMAPRSRCLLLLSSSRLVVPPLSLSLSPFSLGIARDIPTFVSRLIPRDYYLPPAGRSLPVMHRRIYEAEMLARAWTDVPRGSAISLLRARIKLHISSRGEANSISRIIGIG